MRDTRAELLTRIEAFLKRTDMGPSHLGQRAGVGSEVVKKLRAGKDVTTRSADKLVAFMAAWPDVPPFRRATASGKRRSDLSATPRS